MGGTNPVANTIGKARMNLEIDEIEKSIRWLVGKIATHQQYLQSYCPAPA